MAVKFLIEKNIKDEFNFIYLIIEIISSSDKEFINFFYMKQKNGLLKEKIFLIQMHSINLNYIQFYL